jgi:hypothetical protein
MKLRYFIVAGDGELRRVCRHQVEALWCGLVDAPTLGSEARNELRLVSVLCDNRLVPKKIYLLRVPLTAGYFTRESYLTLRIFTMPSCVTPREMVQHHTDGWPRNAFTQLAVALDVPRSHLDVPLGIGGPLLLAAAMRVSPRKAIRYLK